MNKPKPRGRPRGFDKDKILQIILEEFWARGFAATSLDDLSGATGLSRPSLYAAYGGKTEMYAAALQAFGKRMQERAGPALLDADDLVTALTGFYSAALDVYFNGKTQALGCLVFTTAIADVPQETVAHRSLNLFLGNLDHALDTCLARFLPDAPADERQKLTQIASGMLTNMAIRARSGATRAELDELAKASAACIETAARKP